MTTIEEILRRRMRLPAPKPRTPVTPWQMGGLAVPWLWAFVYPVDRIVVLLHVEGAWLYELLAFLTALAIFLALIFSPRDEVVPWEQVAEPRQRQVFYVACAFSLAGLVLLGMTGGGFRAYIYLALAVLTLLWLALPWLVLSGNRGALGLLLFSMRMGMVWFTSMFFILAIRDGMGQIMDNGLPAVALGFAGATYWCFLLTANRLVSDEAGEWPVLSPGWERGCGAGLLLAGCLALLWVLTGFTNDGTGQYGAVAYDLVFPFYDVAAFLEPSAFSNGPLLLLHAIPWQEMFFPGSTTGGGSLLHTLSSVHWLGLACLAVAVFGIFGAFFCGMLPRLTALYALFSLVAAAATGVAVVSAWRAFASRPEGAPVGGADHFLRAGQHIPALACCALAITLAAAMLVWLARRRAGRQLPD